MHSTDIKKVIKDEFWFLFSACCATMKCGALRHQMRSALAYEKTQHTALNDKWTVGSKTYSTTDV